MTKQTPLPITMCKLLPDRTLRYAYLQHTQVESWNLRTPKSKSWKTALALLDEDGSWVVSCHWRSNAHRKAIRELANAGWREFMLLFGSKEDYEAFEESKEKVKKLTI